MTPTRAALLRDVAAAIVESGYAVPPQPKRPYVRRGEQIAELARERWIECRPHEAAYSALIDDVMNRYSVSRRNAGRLIRQARKMREEKNGRL